jgi:hypothetical protein
VKNIKRTSDIVKDILENCPDARNSDDLLYINVCKKLSPMVCHQPLEMVFLMRKEFGLPCYESVRRTRQKLQAAYPELCGSDEVEAQRVVNEGIVRDYARRFSV